MNSKFALLAFLSVAAPLTLAADVPPPKQAVDSRAVMTGEEVIRILDETVDWYRTLGTQQQAATQPSDLLILYANRQTADKVVALAFEIARANAELISSEVGAAQANEAAASSTSLLNVRKRLDEQRDAIQSEIESARRELGSAPAKQRADLRAKVALLQSELDLINARRNLLANMTQFSSQNDAEGFGANALKAHIDAIAASIPTSATPAATPGVAEANPSGSSVLSASLTDFGVWDLGATVLRLSAKGSTIETVDRRTADLLEVFRKVRAQPQERLKELADEPPSAGEPKAGEKGAAESPEDSS